MKYRLRGSRKKINEWYKDKDFELCEKALDDKQINAECHRCLRCDRILYKR